MLDSLPVTNFDFDLSEPLKCPEAKIPEIENDRDWVKTLYKEILLREVDNSDEGLTYWLQQLQKGVARKAIEDYFRGEATKENHGDSEKELEKILGDEKPEDRVLITMPESLGDCLHITCLLPDARNIYKDKVIYVATKPEFQDVFKPLLGDLIDRVIDWRPEFDNAYALEGYAGQKKYFQIMLCAHFPTQRMISYIHNGEDRSEIELNYAPTRSL